MNNIILTGIARSGTTLVCSLLNELPQTIALLEPMNPSLYMDCNNDKEFLEKIESFFAQQRDSLLASKTAISMARNGKIPDNTFDSNISSNGLRKSIVIRETVHFNKFLNPDFALVIKHPNFFTATLATLKTKYRCFAIIRNPLAVLSSWNSIQLGYIDGHAPVAEAFDANLKYKLSIESDTISRQLIMLSWYFEQYQANIPKENIIKYEDIINSNGKNLLIITSRTPELNQKLESRNRNILYDHSKNPILIKRLLASEGAYWNYYSRESVKELDEFINSPKHESSGY